jgi:DNA-binding MarR family transcriptional regulator
VTLNESPDARSRLLDEVIEEMVAWRAKERVGVFRQWVRGSLSLVHLHVLTVLESDGPLSMGKLADALDVSVASATGIIDRMEDRGLVERRREGDDRRVVHVAATEAGRAVFIEVANERKGHLRRLLDGLSEDELTAFLVGARALRRERERHLG